MARPVHRSRLPYIEPTVVQVKNEKNTLLQQELFAPILPILPVKSLDEAIRIANGVCSTPLAIYPFGTDAEMNAVLDQTRSGGASLNDCLVHDTMHDLPFGGVGESGYGAYHGVDSFDGFTHRRSITKTPRWNIEWIQQLRYPPSTKDKHALFLARTVHRPFFNINGMHFDFVPFRLVVRHWKTLLVFAVGFFSSGCAASAARPVLMV